MAETARHGRPCLRVSASLLPLVLLLVSGACSSRDAQTAHEPSDQTPPAGAVSATGVLEPSATSEPLPPEWLELNLVGDVSPGGDAVVEVVIRPEADGDVDLEIVEPAALSFASGGRSQRHQVSREGPPVRERLAVNVGANPAMRITVRLHLLDEDGNPSLVMDRSLSFGDLQTPRAQQRVAVVRTLSDGSRIVQHMTRAEALRQGLSIEERPPAPEDDASPVEDVPPDAGGDRPPVRPPG